MAGKNVALPIFLSIGYSTCHWCHVMEIESFTDSHIARQMNDNFVCIKVDREERPDLDKIYITAVTSLTGSAGWPLNVFLTPDLKPFFGGTYFPPQPVTDPSVLNQLLQTRRKETNMDFLDVINNRRAVNFFDPDKDVPQELLKAMIETAAKAPSSFNLQPWSLIVLRDKEEKTKLQKLAWDQPKVTEAPVTLIVLADRNGWQEGHRFVEKNFQEMIKAGSMAEEQRQWFEDARASLYGLNSEMQQAFACKNTGFFAMALMLAAKNLGLETHPMDGFDHQEVRKAFSIPENYWIPLLMSVGYFRAEKELAPPKWRKTYDEIVVKFD